MGNIAESCIGSFRMILDSSMINPSFRKELVRIIKKYKGKTPLHMLLSDKESGYKIELVSRKFNVRVCNELISDLQKIGIAYNIIKK